jgi:beta-xylosidase
MYLVPVSHMRFLFCLFMIISQKDFSQNPIIRQMYTADPSAHVFNDTLYIYPSHDKEDAHWFDMSDWHVFSTTDMKQWKDYGIIFSLDSIRWATNYAWAPDCAYRNGKYYFYYPVDKQKIGVAVSGAPYGPFKDPVGKPLITRQTPGVVSGRDLIDPCIFIDDDSTPYLLFGQKKANIVKLNDDMISFDDTARLIKGAKHFFEAIWMHKYKGNYYLSYSGKGKILYGMSKSPYGPFKYKGVILDKVNSGTTHASIAAYQGQWYLFYHTSDLFFTNHPGAGKHSIKRWYRRSVCVDRLYYNADGTIQKVMPAK